MERRSGAFLLFGAAFLALVGATAALAIASLGFLEDLATLWLSVGLSVLALLLAVVSVVVSGRR